MPRRKKQHLRLMVLALVCLGGATMIGALEATINPTPVSAAETANRADDFVESMCVNTHLGYTNSAYNNYYNVKQKLVELGIRHVRDGGSSADVIAKMQDLASVGIKTHYIMNPNAGVAPNWPYWVTAPYYYINDFVKNVVGTNVIDAVEILNEINVFYNLNGGYYWYLGDTEKLNNDPNAFYWLYYVRSVTQDTWTALKSDPATAGVKVIGPSLAGTYDYSNKSPLGDLSAYVDAGNIHPYPNGGNPFSYPFSYNTSANYYAHSNFPAVNIDEFPFAFDVYAPPFGFFKPIVATETGYHTGTASKSISEKVHGKYMPRLFLEYFRLGIVRTCSYEFVDEWNDPNNPEANYGLLRNDFSPKPAYTALKNLISLLRDPGTSFTPGSLDYALTVYPLAWYDRTQYVHHLLLQKRDGTFYLVLWHEISNSDISSTPVREITPPDMPVTLTLNQAISSATVYFMDDFGNMFEAVPTISNNTLSLNVPDKAIILKLTPS